MLLPLPAQGGASGGGGAAGERNVDVGSLSGIRSGAAGRVDTQIAIITSSNLVRQGMKLLPAAEKQRGWNDPKAQWASVSAHPPFPTT
jgi:hypothetical protein